MGRTYQFECPKCEYRVRVSGRTDAGQHVVIRTIQCADCKALYDAVIKLKVIKPPDAPVEADKEPPPPPKPLRVPTFATALNRLPPRGRLLEWKTFPLQCPIAPEHRVKEWQQPGKCPKCGVFLDPSPLPFRLWE